MNRRALIMGFFSTVGDIECLQVVQRWCDQTGLPHDTAPYSKRIREMLPGSLHPRKARPDNYSHLIVVCGPCWEKFFCKEKIELDRFAHCVRIGINLTMIAPVEIWNPFDVLLERDSLRMSRPDLTFLETTPRVPVAARCLIGAQKEYGNRQRHKLAACAINDLIARRGYAVIEVDTRCRPPGEDGVVNTPARVISLISRADFVLTTRLHGLVFALKAGVPVIALDPIAGGDKVSAQAKTLGWPKITLAETATNDWMDQAAAWCLSSEARTLAETCRRQAGDSIRQIEREFQAALHQHKAEIPSSRARSRRWLGLLARGGR